MSKSGPTRNRMWWILILTQYGGTCPSHYIKTWQNITQRPLKTFTLTNSPNSLTKPRSNPKHTKLFSTTFQKHIKVHSAKLRQSTGASSESQIMFPIAVTCRAAGRPSLPLSNHSDRLPSHQAPAHIASWDLHSSNHQKRLTKCACLCACK